MEPFGVSWASCWRPFLRPVFVGRYGTGSWLHFGRYGAGFGSILGGTELDFGFILMGLGGVWGRFWEGCGRVWRLRNCSFLGQCFLFRVLVVGAFRNVWVENKVP